MVYEGNYFHFFVIYIPNIGVVITTIFFLGLTLLYLSLNFNRNKKKRIMEEMKKNKSDFPVSCVYINENIPYKVFFGRVYLVSTLCVLRCCDSIDVKKPDELPRIEIAYTLVRGNLKLTRKAFVSYDIYRSITLENT